MKSIRFTLLVCMILALSALAGAQAYTRIAIPNPTPGASLGVFAINNAGHAVGSATFGGSSHAFLWSKAAGMQDLGTLPGYENSRARGINRQGDVTGYSCTSQLCHAFLWTESTGMQDLGTLPGDTDTFANGINDDDEVVGISFSSGPYRAFLYTPGLGMQDLGNLGIPGASAAAINNSGQIVGDAIDPNTNELHPILWTEQSGMQDLWPSLGQYRTASAISINDSGEVVGWENPGGSFLWTNQGGINEIGGFTAYDINVEGQVTGQFKVNTRVFHALLWTPEQGAQDLNTLADYKNGGLYDAGAINNAGQIVADTRGLAVYLLTPKMNVTLASSSNPSNVGQAVTFTVTVNSSVQGPPPDGETVTFKSGNTILGVGTITSGVASFTTSSLKAGTHGIKAVYFGDVNYTSEASAVLSQLVNI